MSAALKASPLPLLLVDTGLVEYSVMHEEQRSLVEKKKKRSLAEDVLILVEHPEVYTYGRKSPVRDKSLPSFEVERGGETTYHNPGQLVGYPILELREGERDLHKHLRRLETTIIDVLQEFGLEGESRVGATGVWLKNKNKKIASIGIAVSGWITYHGCALNVENDLSGFRRINPCGFEPDVMTSMKAELQNPPSMETVKNAFVRHFLRVFERAILA